MATEIMSTKLDTSTSYTFQDSTEMDTNSQPSPTNSNTMDYQNGDNSSQDTKNPVTTVPVDVDTPMAPDVIINSAEDLQQPQAVEIITERIKIPRLSSRDLARPKRQHSPCKEAPIQFGFLFNGHGIKNDPTKIISSSTTKIRLLELDECVKRAKKYALEQSVRYVLVKQQQQQQKQQLELIKKQQALLLMCRVYVGSIFYEVKEDTVRMAFSPFGPIRSISMSWDAATNKHKGFAFIEFETPEAAQLSLEQMNNVLLGGRNIKVGRPSNMPQAQPIIDQLTEEAKNYNRIYVSSIHQDLLEQDVQSVFEAFGPIKTCTLVRDSQVEKHKGYGFIEYETTQAAQDAIASMNLFDLGGQFLRVGKAVTPPEGLNPQPVVTQLPTASALAAANITAQIQAQDAEHTPSSAASFVSTVYSQVSSTSSIKPSANSPLSVPPSLHSSNTYSLLTAASNTQSMMSVTSSALDPLKQAQQAALAVNKIIENSEQEKKTPQQLQEAKQVNAMELTENQKQILGMTSTDDPSASLEQQVELTLKGKEQRLLLMQKLMQRKTESKVIVLRNMVGPEDVDEYLESEITDECGKYGDVVQVVIYNEKQDEGDDAEVLVKIFVEFKITQSSVNAINSLNGRYFAGRIVKAELYDQAAFNSKDYSC